MHARFLLLLDLFGLAVGQFHLRNDGLYNGNISLYSPPAQFDEARSPASMCYTGDTIFIIERIPASGTVNIYELTSADNYSSATVTMTFPEGTRTGLPSVDCCCRYLVYGQPDSASSYAVVMLRTDNTEVMKEYRINQNIGDGVVQFDCTTGTLRLVTRTSLFIFDINDPGDTFSQFTYDTALTAAPRCAGFGQIDEEEYLFASFEDRASFELIPLTGNSAMEVTMYELSIEGQSLKISCMYTEGTTVHFFARDPFSETGYLLSQEMSNITNDEDRSITVFSTTSTFALQALFEFVNGLSVCTGCSSLPCLSERCSCTDANCGFCTPFDPTLCVCENSVSEDCTYVNPTVAALCEVPVARMDASCVVLNPIAERRSGGDINVGLVVSSSESTEITHMDVQRAAKTGRWPTTLLPRWQNLVASGSLQLGYRMPVQPNARGRRFGIFNTVITRSDSIVEEIFCIATERSAFRNQVFSVVCVEGTFCQLSAEMDNSQYLQQVRWRRTSLQTGVVTDFPDFDGMLSISFNQVSKELHEGVFEVFRENRYLRTWHPIIYLYVRECPVDRYGPSCNRPCPNCNHGICDSRTGECRCYPGFSGTNCGIACPAANLIGQSCDIDCNGLFFGDDGNECINLEICNGDDLGCQCRSGLQLPACDTVCPTNTWGTNCVLTCNCGVDQTCDPRIGCV